MNELTKEASKQTILEAISFLRLGRGRKDRDSLLDTYRKRKDRTGHYSELQGNFKDYLTEIDVSSPCETLPEDYQNHLDRKYVKKSDNLDAFREYCKQLDADDAEIERTEKRLF